MSRPIFTPVYILMRLYMPSHHAGSIPAHEILSHVFLLPYSRGQRSLASYPSIANSPWRGYNRARSSPSSCEPTRKWALQTILLASPKLLDHRIRSLGPYFFMYDHTRVQWTDVTLLHVVRGITWDEHGIWPGQLALAPNPAGIAPESIWKTMCTLTRCRLFSSPSQYKFSVV